MKLHWCRLILDDWGTCLRLAPPQGVEPARLLLLPDDVDPANKTWSELVLLSRTKCCESVLDYQLAEYWPAYLGKLAADLETARAEGRSVFLWDRAGTLRLLGYAGLLGDAAPWCDAHQRYAHAQQALLRISLAAME